MNGFPLATACLHSLRLLNHGSNKLIDIVPHLVGIYRDPYSRFIDGDDIKYDRYHIDSMFVEMRSQFHGVWGQRKRG